MLNNVKSASGGGRRCKECHKALPKGNSVVSWTARLMGYCRYCYRMNFPMRPDRLSRRLDRLPDEATLEVTGEGNMGADIFNPDSPWDWYEYYFPEKDR